MTSGFRLVKPQAIRPLWPITTPGMPENVKPSTLKPQSQCRPIWNQMPGIDVDRCGSLANSGFPVVVRLPLITQELEPIPGSFSPPSGMPSIAALTAFRALVSPVFSLVGAATAASPAGAGAWVNVPLLTVPPARMGAF